MGVELKVLRNLLISIVVGFFAWGLLFGLPPQPFPLPNNNNSAFQALDLGFWIALPTVVTFGLISLMTSQNRNRLIAIAVIGALAFSFFVPVQPVRDTKGNLIQSGGYAGGRPFQNATLYGSMSYLYFCEGALYWTSGQYSLSICQHGSIGQQAG